MGPMQWLVLLVPGMFLAGGIAFTVAGANNQSGTIRGPRGSAPAGPRVMIGVGIVMIIGAVAMAIPMIINLAK